MGNIDFSIGCGPAPLVPTGPVTLAFNPAWSKDPLIRKVFGDRVARNLWIGVKWRHIVSQFFNDDCVAIARWIQNERPQTPMELTRILSAGRDPVFRIGWNDKGHTLELAEALFPYVCGKQDFEYVVKLDG